MFLDGAVQCLAELLGLPLFDEDFRDLVDQRQFEMRTRSEGYRRNDLPKSAHPRHLCRLDNEIRIEGEENNEERCREANNQAKQM